jgi:hypothetical protein
MKKILLIIPIVTANVSFAQQSRNTNNDTLYILVKADPLKKFTVHHLKKLTHQDRQYFIYDSSIHAFIGYANTMGFKNYPNVVKKEK